MNDTLDRYAADQKFLRENADFKELAPEIRNLIMKSPHASADYRQFLQDGGAFIQSATERLAIYRAEPDVEIQINDRLFNDAHLAGRPDLAARLFSVMAHEIGHHKTLETVFPPSGVEPTRENYVRFSAEQEAKGVFNAFPIFDDLRSSAPDFVPD